MRLQLESAIPHSGDAAPITASGSGSHRGLSRSGATAADSIGISGPSAALGKLAADRTERIRQLTQAVRSGSYQAPSAAISASIVAQSLA
jgi:anti-sigma28 factor (negative regulator of flagellin synthesis)